MRVIHHISLFRHCLVLLLAAPLPAMRVEHHQRDHRHREAEHDELKRVHIVLRAGGAVPYLEVDEKVRAFLRREHEEHPDLGADDLIDWAGGHPTYKAVYQKPSQGARALAVAGGFTAAMSTVNGLVFGNATNLANDLLKLIVPQVGQQVGRDDGEGEQEKQPEEVVVEDPEGEAHAQVDMAAQLARRLQQQGQRVEGPGGEEHHAGVVAGLL